MGEMTTRSSIREYLEAGDLEAALRYCFARYRTCRSYAKWLAERMVGEEGAPEDPRKLLDWIYERVRDKVSEERGQGVSAAAVEEEARRMAARLASILVSILADNYGW